MARFLNHTSCERCGSSDAKALYDDGSSFCFSCRGVNGASIFRSKETAPNNSRRSLPDDCTNVLRDDALNWCSKYGLSPEQLFTNNVLYSPSKQQVIFTFPPTELWQARNLWRDSKVKYFTSGNHDNILPIYSQNPETKTIIVVEDCLSSIKCSYTGNDSMPCLGSSLHPRKLAMLARLYEEMVVWLDHDKGLEAQKIANKAKLLGLDTKVIHTELDPKCYSENEIKNHLQLL